MRALDVAEVVPGASADEEGSGEVLDSRADLALVRHVVSGDSQEVLEVSREVLERAAVIEQFCREEVAPVVEVIVGIGMRQIDEVVQRIGKSPKLLAYERDGHVLATTMIAIEKKTPDRVPFPRKLVPFSRHTTIWTRGCSGRVADAEMLATYIRQLREDFIRDDDMVVHVDAGLAGSIPTFLSPKFFDDLYNVMWLFCTDVEYPEDSRLEILDWRYYGRSKMDLPWLAEQYEKEGNPYPPFYKFGPSIVSQGDVMGGLWKFMEKFLTGGTRSSVRGIEMIDGRARSVFSHYPRGSEDRIVKTAAYRGFIDGLRRSSFTLNDVSPESVPELGSRLKADLKALAGHPLVRSIGMSDMGMD